MTPEEQQLLELWHPEAARHFARVVSEKKRFVHYTSAQAAMSILRKREVWLRNISCMNDYTEVLHGIDCLVKAYASPIGQQLKRSIDDLFPGLGKEVEDLFNGHQSQLQFGTYIACFSEHDEEDKIYGKLSMWRAYGRDAGVAFVFKNTMHLVESDALNAWSSPVAYLAEDGFMDAFEKFAKGLLAARPIVTQMTREEVKHRLFYSFMFAAVCTKHQGFQEEKEWRLVHLPKVYPSELVQSSVELIGTVPQLVYKLPLKNVPAIGLARIEISDLLDQIIIGPTDYPLAMRDAFARLLEDCGVDDPLSKIAISWIPLRSR